MIGDHEYTVQAVSPTEYKVHKWDGGDIPVTTYKVVVRNGSLKCDCIGHRYNHHCKHTNWVKEFRRLERSGMNVLKFFREG